MGGFSPVAERANSARRGDSRIGDQHDAKALIAAAAADRLQAIAGAHPSGKASVEGERAQKVVVASSGADFHEELTCCRCE
ncbi:hypothetical protein [Afifella marina]|uniref:hypothetical protein n=1 Tax=Afifella marina TaxID=1080 RepID=UPI000B827938|nr:hypothetical protein [Afifella marina]MBK1624424.1 hypothetical protein [Afifella marina DSM 2698]MBK1628156.1 hypothetical protein [Afifella marina]MBK5916590.1 hypothetical protein [Afifella marina]RAI18951.1 hypothetical protein CH311_13920 [Afifella marina DSM 2698]